MTGLATSRDLSQALVEALNLPENTTKFAVLVEYGKLVTVIGEHEVTVGELQAFERVFKDKAELHNPKET